MCVAGNRVNERVCQSVFNQKIENMFKNISLLKE